MKFLLVTSLLVLLSFAQDSCLDAYDCEESTMNDDSVYCNGYYACEDADITCSDECDCSGDNGCILAAIQASDGAPVECWGYEGCYRAHIINEEGAVQCHGALGCFLADVIGYAIYLDGYYSGLDSVFTADSSTETSFVYWNEGLYSGAYGDVVVGSGNTLNLYYYGYYSGYRNYIDCESGSTCSLTCLGMGCADTELFCYSGATCSYDCSGADECPTVYDISSTISTSSTLSDTSKKNKRRLLANEEEFKQIREERREFREKQKPIDYKKWSQKSPAFKKHLDDANKNRKISNHNSQKKTQTNSKTSFISKNSNSVVKDLTSRHILYGVGISSAIYFTLTLMWYFMYYKPRKEDMYNVV